MSHLGRLVLPPFAKSADLRERTHLSRRLDGRISVVCAGLARHRTPREPEHAILPSSWRRKVRRSAKDPSSRLLSSLTALHCFHNLADASSRLCCVMSEMERLAKGAAREFRQDIEKSAAFFLRFLGQNGTRAQCQS